MKKFFFLCTFLLSSRLIAAADPECSPVNLTAEKQVFNGIPTYDQGGGQICFAYTAAQIIEGQRVLEGHSYTKAGAINPLSIALSLAITKKQTDLQQGGVACDAVNHARNNPACPVSKSFSNAGEIEKHISDYKECKNYPDSPKCAELTEKYSLNKNIFLQKNPLLYVKAVEDAGCSEKEKIQLKIPECIFTNDESKSNSHFKKLVDDVFSSKSPRPVEIGYSMNLLSYSGIDKKSYRIERKVEPDVVFFSLKYKPHSSVLLGRKTGKNGQCQYLLRNTQGKEFCPAGIVAKMGWECDKKSEGIWINSAELFESTFQISNISE